MTDSRSEVGKAQGEFGTFDARKQQCNNNKKNNNNNSLCHKNKRSPIDESTEVSERENKEVEGSSPLQSIPADKHRRGVSGFQSSM